MAPATRSWTSLARFSIEASTTGWWMVRLGEPGLVVTRRVNRSDGSSGGKPLRVSHENGSAAGLAAELPCPLVIAGRHRGAARGVRRRVGTGGPMLLVQRRAEFGLLVVLLGVGAG